MGSPRSDLWWNRPDVWAGAALAGFAAVDSFSPSLMPRTTTHQALLAGVSGTAGWAIGSAVYAIGARTDNAGADTAIMASTATAGLATRYLIPWHEQEAAWRAPVRSLGQVIGAGAASAAVTTAVRNSSSRLVVGAVAGTIATVIGAATISREVAQQKANRDELDHAPPRPWQALVQGAGVLGGLGALIGGYRSSGGALARVMERRLAFPPQVARFSGDILATAIWAIGVRTAFQYVTSGLARYDRVVDPGYDIPPTVTTRSGGPGSEVPWSRLGRQGRRFITDTPSAGDIESVMGTPAVNEPVRVFVGFDAAGSAEARVALAMEELKRTGAFDRSLLIVSCPAGTGYVNTLPMEVADYVTLGDCAAVAVQYARLPSLLVIQQTHSGADHHRLLLAAIEHELDVLPPERRPRVVVFGESLGAWAGQDAFIGGGIDSIRKLGVSEALWVGTPYYSKWRHESLYEGQAPDGTIEQINGIDELDLESEERVVTLLTHYNDPVDRINATLFYKEPTWLMESPPKRGISPNQRWRPGITAFQTIVDAINATNPTPGVFRAVGHDYRLDLPAVTVAAYRLPEPNAEQWKRMLTRLQADEKARVNAMRRAAKPLFVLDDDDLGQ
ncbi:MAG: alpha/beta-hydrolase family protein [Acidimicrobiia bacterium]|nr:alpha/beta-hydrolase family protein [Acidimicrobiia bacterium]